ncbi:MAG: penicillin-binding protein, partial [Rhodobiaceae bacterium]|nr:penicillin-binding protein [Rhodobiaceae bacterium]
FMEEALKTEPTPPFRIPSAVSLVRINAVTGKLARPDDETVILEAFKLGNEPSVGSKQAIVRGQSGTTRRKRPAVNTETVGAGTGGLY